MKVVVSCDAVVSRDYYLEIIETVLDTVGEQCELYTITHEAGAVIGPIEQRKIHASFLSNMTKSWQQLLANSYLIPSAAKRLFIPCSVDLVINISKGFSQGIRKCENTQQITFLVDDENLKTRKKTFKERIFSLLTESYQRKSLNQADTLWTSSLELLPVEQRERAKVVAPPINLDDYKILPAAMFVRDYFVVNAEALTLEAATNFLEKYRDQKFKFIGDDEHLNSLKEGQETFFFGDRCGGELAPLLSGAKFLIDFEERRLPIYMLRALACGRPVLSKGNKFVDFGPGHFAWSDELPSELPDFEPKKARGLAVRFDELKFKHLINNSINKLGSKTTPYNVPDKDCC